MHEYFFEKKLVWKNTEGNIEDSVLFHYNLGSVINLVETATEEAELEKRLRFLENKRYEIDLVNPSYYYYSNDSAISDSTIPTEEMLNGQAPYVVEFTRNWISINGTQYSREHFHFQVTTDNRITVQIYPNFDISRFVGQSGLVPSTLSQELADALRDTDVGYVESIGVLFTADASNTVEVYRERIKAYETYPAILRLSANSTVSDLLNTVEVTDTQSTSLDVRAKITGEDLVNNPKISFAVSYMDFDYIYDLTSSTWTTDSKDFTITNNSRVAENWNYDMAYLDVSYVTTHENLTSIIQGTLSRADDGAVRSLASTYELAKPYTFTLKISNKEEDKNVANKALGKLSETEFQKIGALTVSYDKPIVVDLGD